MRRSFSVPILPTFLVILRFLASVTSLLIFLFPLLNRDMIEFLFWALILSSSRRFTRRILIFSAPPRATSLSLTLASRFNTLILSPLLKRVRNLFLFVWLIFNGVRKVRRFCLMSDPFSFFLCSKSLVARFFREFKLVSLSMLFWRLFLSSSESFTLIIIVINFCFWLVM